MRRPIFWNGGPLITATFFFGCTPLSRGLSGEKVMETNVRARGTIKKPGPVPQAVPRANISPGNGRNSIRQ